MRESPLHNTALELGEIQLRAGLDSVFAKLAVSGRLELLTLRTFAAEKAWLVSQTGPKRRLPRRLVWIDGTRFRGFGCSTCAWVFKPSGATTGKIVLWVPSGSKVDVSGGLKALTDPAVRKIAIANPEHAPYGQAAVAAVNAARRTP